VTQSGNNRIYSPTPTKLYRRAWKDARNNKNAKINWQFTTGNARIKLRKLYPTFIEGCI
jgi:hypothetical protein